MKKYFRLFFVPILFCLQISKSLAQDVVPELIHYYHGDNFQYWGIPNLNSDEKYAFQTNYSGYTGVRKVVYSSYTNGIYTGKMDTKGIALGGNLLYSQIGEYINYTQLKMLVAYKATFREDFYMIQSVNAGVANLVLGAGSGGGGSSFNPDVSLGNFIYYKKLMIGNAVDHVADFKFEPLSGTFHYNQKYNGLLAYKFDFNLNQFEHFTSFLYSYNFQKNYLENRSQYILTEQVSFYKKFKLFCNTIDFNILGLGGGFTYNKLNWSAVVDMGFYVPLSPNAVNSNRYQLRLSFSKNK